MNVRTYSLVSTIRLEGVRNILWRQELIARQERHLYPSSADLRQL